MLGRLMPRLFGRAGTAAPAVPAQHGAGSKSSEVTAGAGAWGRRCPGGVGHLCGVGEQQGWRGLGRITGELKFTSQLLRETKIQVKAPVNPDFNPL